MMAEPNATSSSPRPRLFFVDYLRGWAVIVMVLAHFWPVLPRPGITTTQVAQTAAFMFGFAPALFFGVVGVSARLALARADAGRLRQSLTRGALVALAGFPWTLMLREPAQFDFLHFIGFSMVACALLCLVRKREMLAVVLMIACWAGLYWLHLAAPDPEPAAGPFAVLLNAVTLSGRFPIQGWLPVTLLGFLLAGTPTEGRVWVRGVVSGGVLSVAAAGCVLAGLDLTKFPVSLAYSFLACGVFALAFGLCSALEPASRKVPLGKATVILGQFALPATALHWLIGRVFLARAHVAGKLDVLAFALVTLAVVALMVWLYRPWQRLVEWWGSSPSGWVRSPLTVILASALCYAVGYAGLYLWGFRFHETVSGTMACAGVLVLCLPLYGGRRRVQREDEEAAARQRA